MTTIASSVLRRGTLYQPLSLLTNNGEVLSSWRSLSIHRVAAFSSASENIDRQPWLNYAVANVRQYDPAGWLPGRLLPDATMRTSYFAVRSFWVETGLRFGSTAKVPPNATPAQHLDWWQEGIDRVFSPSYDNDEDERLTGDYNHPSLQLLSSLLRLERVSWEKHEFDTILDGRRRDLHVKQYDTLDDLIRHAEQSCGSLSQLVLESGQVTRDSNPAAFEAARLVGIGHGLTNALRTSIPVISTTGKLVVPADLTQKYRVKSPRYLLSALGQGSDEQCVQALQNAVRDISDAARDHLARARALRRDILRDEGGTRAVAVLLPGLASETFLNRLERSRYQLTDRDLRHVGFLEHATCAARMVLAHARKRY